MYPFILFMIIYPVRCSLVNDSTDPERLIYGGYDVGIHEYPHAVFLSFEATSPSSCGSSLIMVQAVLTAAHCVDELRYKRGKMFAYLGAKVPGTAKTVRRVVDFIINPKYCEQTGKNNLAVAFMESRVPLLNEIKKIPLTVEDPAVGDIVYSAGWGKQKVTTGIPSLPDRSSWRPLSGTKQRILSTSQCSKYAGFKVSPQIFCSIPEKGHFYKDDSGNGLVMRSPNTLLAGVLSFVAYGISVYTGVRGHRDWIIDSCHKLYLKNCPTTTTKRNKLP